MTVLRDPLERICSLYLYFLQNSKTLSEDEIRKPARKTLLIARDSSVDDFFLNMDRPKQAFLKEHFDNLYTYFFAARKYLARKELRGSLGEKSPNEDGIVQVALRNLNSLDYVGGIGDLVGLSRFIRSEFSVDVAFGSANVNRQSGSRSRFEIVESMIKDKRALDRLHDMTSSDNRLLSLFNRHSEVDLGAKWRLP